MRVLSIAVALMLAAPHVSPGQQPSQMSILLNQARNALNDLRYSRADSIARDVLALGKAASRNERVEALRIAAAALFPDEARLQHRDSAVGFLRRLVRLEPDREIPRDIAWAGLDSLLEEVRATTFGAIGRPQRNNPIIGVASAISMPVTATRPTRFRLIAIGQKGGSVLVLDSAGPARDAVLHFGVTDGDRIRLSSGAYILRLTAVDGSTTDTITDEYASTVEAPALGLVPVPGALDSSRLLPERTRPARSRNVLIGLGLGVSTVLLTSVLRADHPVRDSSSVGPAGYGAAAGLSLGVIVWGLRDKGSTLPRNVAANAQLREDFARALRNTQTENEQRRATYRATVTIDPEPLQ